MKRPRKRTPSVAVIDIGSNSVRLVVYESLTRSLVSIFNEKTLCGLGREVQSTGLLAPDAEVAVNWGSNYGPLTLQGQWWRLFTSMFVHFGILHLALNMFALYQTGRMVERMFGSLHFLLLYVFAGLSGSMVSLWWHPMINSAGASGAIFGVFGGLLAFMLNPKNAVPRAVMTAHRNSTVFFIGFNLLNGFTHAGIDNGAHIGGLLGGIVFGFLLARPLDMGVRSVAGAGRLALSCLACLLVLGALSYPMSHPDADFVQEQRFRDALQTFSQQEKQTIGETQRLIGQVRANAIS